MTQYPLVTVPNWQYYNPQQNTEAGLFAKLASKFRNGKTISPNLGVNLDSIKGLSNNIRNTNLMGLGKIGSIANIGLGAYQGLKGLYNINKLNDSNSDLDSVRSNIITSAMRNPMVTSYLTTDQKNLLRKVQNDTYGSGTQLSAGLESSVKSIPKTLLSALVGFLIGNIPGAIISGVGTLANAGIEGVNTKTQQNTAQLQGLYETLAAAEQDYNSMRRPSNLNYAGLQRRYANQLA